MKQAANSERAADVIARDLEQRILSGDIPDNTPLPAEKELCATYQASRTVIREVITALTHRGILENRPRFRPMVRKPGYQAAFETMGSIVQQLTHEKAGIRTLYQSRIFLERALVREAALRAQSADIKALKEALEENRAAIDSSEDFYATDVAFHRILYRIPQNPIFPAIHMALTQWLYEPWQRMERSPERNNRNYRQHHNILNAILERDPDAAEAALELHLNDAWDHVNMCLGPEQHTADSSIEADKSYLRD